MLNYKRGQILVIVLVIITVIAIGVVSTTNVLIKDTQNTDQENRYNTIFSVAEDLAIQFGLKFGNPGSSNRVEVFGEGTFVDFLDGTGFKIREGSCSEITKDGEYPCFQCEVEREEVSEENDATALNKEANLGGTVSVCDTPYIENAEVNKDEILVFNLEEAAPEDSLDGIYTLSILKNSITPQNATLFLEVTADFTYKVIPSGEERNASVKRLIQVQTNGTLFNNSINSNPVNLKYITVTGNHDAEYFRYNFNVATIEANIENETDTNAGYIYHMYPQGADIDVIKINQLRIKPYMRPNSGGRLRIGIRTDNPQIEITQGRTIEANIYEIQDGVQTGSQAIVKSTIPATKFPTFFDYIIKTNDLN